MSQIWDNMLPGDVRTFTKVSAESVVKLFKQYVKHHGLSWECEFWTEPACRKAEIPVDKVWIARIDGLPEERIAELRRERGANIYAPSGGRTYFKVDSQKYPPLEEGTRIPRTTKYGWERMQLGSVQTVTMHSQNLYDRLVDVIRNRRLDWQFECFRQNDMEEMTGSKVPIWTVKRSR